MKKCICTTTIYPPSKALLRFIEIAEKDDWHIFVAGDKKTPHEQYRELQNNHSCLVYMSPEDQMAMDLKLSEAIGWNCIQRRNFAFLLAHEWGADIVASVDDDNIPMDGWGRDLMVGQKIKCASWETSNPCFDPLFATYHSHLWHRGFPVQILTERNILKPSCVLPVFTPDIQADLWNGDPDVDALCRLVHNPKNCEFHPELFPFTSDKPAPFNSQNTFLSAKVMPHYCVLPHIGRADDIWPAYHVQAQGFKVVFGKASVVQERNAQDVMKNFEDELLNYRHNLDIVKAINRGEPDAVLKFLPERTALAFKLYQEHFK